MEKHLISLDDILLVMLHIWLIGTWEILMQFQISNFQENF